MESYLIKGALVINEGQIEQQDVLIKHQRFEKIAPQIEVPYKTIEINADTLYLMPGLIDDQVHFREPGLTHKACIQSEARAAVAGGVTSFMEMPNVIPPTLDFEKLADKFSIAAKTALANHSFFLGVSNDNAETALQINRHKQDVCGLKIFMGSSTGNMLVDNIVTLEKVFANSEVLIATHCEKEDIILQNKQALEAKGISIDHARFHPIVRNEAACYESSLLAIQLAKKYDTRLHILHISTENELQLFSNMLPLTQKRITAEVCVHHLYFTANDYEHLGNLIKCNPAIKAAHHRESLWKALLDDRLDIIATDHAPHTLEEKNQAYAQAPAGLPLVQHSLLMLLQAYHEGRISLEKIVEKACHAPAECFQVKHRGFIREGYFADAVLVDINGQTTVKPDNILYQCGWSPLADKTLGGRIEGTFVSGHLAYYKNQFNENNMGLKLSFDR